MGDFVENGALKLDAVGPMNFSNENGGKIDVKAADYYLYANNSDVDIIATEEIVGALKTATMDAPTININIPHKALRIDSGGSNYLTANNISLVNNSTIDSIIPDGADGEIGYIEFQGTDSTTITANNEITFRAETNLKVNDVYLDKSTPQTNFIANNIKVTYLTPLKNRPNGLSLSTGNKAPFDEIETETKTETGETQIHKLENMGHVLSNLNALIREDINNYQEFDDPNCKGKPLFDCLSYFQGEIEKNHQATEAAYNQIKNL